MSYKPKHLKKKRLLPQLLTVSSAVFACLMALGVAMVLRNLLQSKNDQKAFQELAQLVQTQTSSSHPTAVPAEEASSETVTVPEKSPYQVLHEKNPDFVAWLTVPGTSIDYPVMHTPQDTEHYIYRAFDGSDSPSGTPFVGDHGDLTSQRCIIYGHNMKDGTMFHDLLNYGKKSFWEENPTFTIYTLEEERTYEIFCAVQTRVLETTERGLRYYRLEDGVENWLVKRALYDTGIVLQEGDSIVILSTCSYHTEEGRFLVAGRLVK